MTQIIKRLIFSLFVIIDKLIYNIFKATSKVDKTLIVFEGQMGNFDESSWVLYQYLKQKGKYKFVWMVKKPQKFSSTDDTKFISRYHYTFNILADYYYAKAFFSFYTHSTSPIKYKRQGQIKVFIGHGYALKRGRGRGRKMFNNFDFAIAIGNQAIETQAIFVGCEKRDLLPLGLPRNDLLIKNKGIGADNPFVKGKGFNKLILWMPTFRDCDVFYTASSLGSENTGLPLFDTMEKIVRLNEFLESHNCAILLKTHRLQMQNEVFNMQLSNLIFITDNIIQELRKQLYEVIGFSDALLTDYSSISVDYLLLDKPIGYILTDIDYYKECRGFTSENPLDVMAGSFIYTEEDCYKFITNILENIDSSSNQRKLLMNKLHAAPNGNSCELFVNYFGL